MLEGKEGPTDKDIALEKEWREAIRETVREHGIPMTTDEINGLSKGVQCEWGRLIRGGTWGGGTEHQALAIILNINIVIWDRRYIGKVSASHKQTYVCSPQGQAFLMNVAQTEDILIQSQYKSIHLLYDHIAKHYEYFDRSNEAHQTHGAANAPIERGEEEQRTGNVKQITGEKSGDNGGVQTPGEPNKTREREEMKQEVHVEGRTTKEPINRKKDVGRNAKHHKTQLKQISDGNAEKRMKGKVYTDRGKDIENTARRKIERGNRDDENTRSTPHDTNGHTFERGRDGGGGHVPTAGGTRRGGGIAAKKDVGEEANTSARRRAGVYYIWDPMKIQVENIEEVYPSRVARATIHQLESGKELEGYGVYIPVRNNNGERIEEIWEKMMTDVKERRTRNFIINGDFNAETEAWIQKTGKTQKEEDVMYHGV
eukprot:6202042-Pleurochrysis_carterae.AAC.3